MYLYRIGPARGAQRIGLARDVGAVVAEMSDGKAQQLAFRTWSLPTGQAQLVERIIQVRYATKAKGDGWFETSPATAEAWIVEAIGWTSAECIERTAVCDLSHQGRALKHLREAVFGTTQGQIGAIVGRHPGVISRWEAGTATPGLAELLKLRAYARALGLPWEDSLLLDPPAA